MKTVAATIQGAMPGFLERVGPGHRDPTREPVPSHPVRVDSSALIERAGNKIKAVSFDRSPRDANSTPVSSRARR